MRFLFWTSVLLLFTLLPPAADAAAPNTLTPQEIADGWILLFDGETSFGWEVEGDAQVANGALVLGGKMETTTTLSFGDFDLQLECRAEGVKMAEILLKRTTPQSMNQSSITVQGVNANIPGWVSLHLKAEGNMVRSEVRTPTGGNSIAKSESAPGASSLTFRVLLRNVKIRPLGLKPIFNGKDLSGWKKFEGEKYKTEFTVTDKGELNLKNGPGDLQTEEQYDDFVLQLECISNGKNLNSGVFFRCRPGEYQQGYEAQIHNGFNADAPKEYKLEEYDPTTNELKGTKAVKYAAIDYGTGAIYRRMPARKQVAKDYEWFTMTVIAQGRRLRTWVNGIQVVDWTDNRPLKDNARNGCRLEKGNISLQGHDPTTDLSFRNLRIAEWMK
jgi:Domain of Unknown Function (DUF1080)